jgi:hypothetical protein
MTANNELELAGSEVLVPADNAFGEALAAEESLWRSTIVWTLIAIPVCIAVFMLLVVLAIGGDDPDWGAWLGISAIVGTLGGAFFGGWAAFTAKCHMLDELDERGARH